MIAPVALRCMEDAVRHPAVQTVDRPCVPRLILGCGGRVVHDVEDTLRQQFHRVCQLLPTVVDPHARHPRLLRIPVQFHGDEARLYEKLRLALGVVLHIGPGEAHLIRMSCKTELPVLDGRHLLPSVVLHETDSVAFREISRIAVYPIKIRLAREKEK